MAAPRPVPLTDDAARPQDDGLFGPQSVTWRAYASPSTSLGIAAAVLLQMIHPDVVRMIDQASNVRTDPAGRAAATSLYGTTITYGDTATAERAGEVLRRIHSHRQAVDPITGETYSADRPDLLLWVHGTLTWAVLAACRQWGPVFTAAEQDRFVDEQRVSARLVGIDPDVAPRTVAELDAYMAGMRPRLAYVTSTRFMREMIVPPKLPFTPAGLAQLALTRAAVDLLPDDIQDLYGFRWTWLNHLLVRGTSALIMKSAQDKVDYGRMIAELRHQTDVHAFGSAAPKLRAKREAAARG
ncbi:MAG: oxygenase MpaB family protein [Thermomicrobiales bacterium]